MPFNMDCPQIDLASLTWDQIGDDDDPRNRLLTSIRIGPLYMHLEAVEVYESKEEGDDWTGSGLRAKFEGRDDYLQTLMDLEEAIFSTLEINGRTYTLWATPFGA